ncbi:MAG: hypothetical protein JRC77_09010 [Deltaproteobacteria bacterium]|nr:hypothetical protein [Deltaproteobacteria bacterium]
MSWNDVGDDSIVGFRIYKRSASGNFAFDREVQIEGANLGLNSEGWFLPSYDVDDQEIEIVAITAFNSAGESSLSNERVFNDDDGDGYPNYVDTAPNNPDIPAEDTGSTPPPPDDGGSTSPPSSGGSSVTTYRLNAGGSSYTDTDGNVWVPDDAFVNTGAAKVVTSSISGTSMDPLYQSKRWVKTKASDYERMHYRLPIANGSYTVTLHFAEIREVSGFVGARVYDVNIEGDEAISNLDVYKLAGDINRAYSHREDAVMVSDGVLNIILIEGTANPTISAIEVVPAEVLEPPGQPQIILP